MKMLTLALTLLSLAGCLSTQTVLLRHPQTGVVMKCGPYRYSTPIAGAVTMEHLKCIEDYQRQGYERVPSPD
jgi:uncharacterized protein YcfL